MRFRVCRKLAAPRNAVMRSAGATVFHVEFEFGERKIAIYCQWIVNRARSVGHGLTTNQ